MRGAIAAIEQAGRRQHERTCTHARNLRTIPVVSRYPFNERLIFFQDFLIIARQRWYDDKVGFPYRRDVRLWFNGEQAVHFCLVGDACQFNVEQSRIAFLLPVLVGFCEDFISANQAGYGAEVALSVGDD